MTIPYVDAKVAAKLCKGGAITYQHVDGSGITDDWILQHVVPNMRNHLEREVCIVFGRALLWRIFFEQRHGGFVHNSIVERMMEAYRDLGERSSLGESENPITKLPLGVTGVDAQLLMDVIATEDENRGGNNMPRGIRVENGMHGEELRLLTSQVVQLRRSVANVSHELERSDINCNTLLRRINLNLSRLVVSPGRRNIGDANTDTNFRTRQGKVAILSSTPRTLHDLWVEWEFGLADNKPAKYFTPRERGGKNKHKFYLRKFFWKQVSKMIRSGRTAQVACDEIYGVYGGDNSVTNILRMMQRDEKNGGNPALRSLLV